MALRRPRRSAASLRTAASGSRRATAAALYEMVKHEGASIVIGGKAPGRDTRSPSANAIAPVIGSPHAGANAICEDALGYAPYKGHHGRSLPDWVNDPLENQ